MTLDDFGLNAMRLIGGFAGGVVHAFTIKTYEPWTAAGSVIVGTLTANFLGPAAQHFAPAWLGDYGASFVVGYCATIILQMMEILVRNRLRGVIPQKPKES
jgi:hypothetical protein